MMHLGTKMNSEMRLKVDSFDLRTAKNRTLPKSSIFYAEK